MSSRTPKKRPPGRPRRAAADDAILRATIDLLVEVGVERTTIGAVAARAKVARATIYLRWPSRAALITAALLHARGRPPYALTGDLEEDLRGGAEMMREVLAEPAFRSVFPLVVRELLREPRSPGGLTYDQLSPNRQRLADAYGRRAGAAGLRTDVDPLLVMDMVMGPLINGWLASGRHPTESDGRTVVDILLNGIRVRP